MNLKNLSQYSKEELKEKTKKFVKSQSFHIRILILIGVLKIWYENTGKFTYRCESLNKYNPITYIIIIILTPFILLVYIVKGIIDYYKEIKNSFKTSRYSI
jgi:hypothetical protein